MQLLLHIYHVTEGRITSILIGDVLTGHILLTRFSNTTSNQEIGRLKTQV